ncbi:hypothetical protein NPIL_692201 [Nephila pilipes]|uniref:Uncharacterized protein n=1 Tax=Nephila pilipes TaxID=299642 RepID=A0A8X6P0B3_NEPPI|nr:hypothetical protein NPIL_692201 [Nephila pilipes]
MGSDTKWILSEESCSSGLWPSLAEVGGNVCFCFFLHLSLYEKNNQAIIASSLRHRTSCAWIGFVSPGIIPLPTGNRLGKHSCCRLGSQSRSFNDIKREAAADCCDMFSTFLSLIMIMIFYFFFRFLLKVETDVPVY